MTEHNRVIQCACGETFKSEDDFETHKRRNRRQAFNDAVSAWLHKHVGGVIADWHDTIKGGKGTAAFGMAQHHDELKTDPESDENVRDAALQFARDALLEGNVREMLHDTYDHDGSVETTHYDEPTTGTLSYYVTNQSHEHDVTDEASIESEPDSSWKVVVDGNVKERGRAGVHPHNIQFTVDN